MNKGFKFRIYPTNQQKEIFEKTFGCVRFIYNKMLEDKIRYYEKTKNKLNNTPAQYKQEYGWLKEVDCQALCYAQIHLQSAYNNFFKQPKTGFPKFKSKKTTRCSYSTTQIKIIDDKYVKLSKIGRVKCKFHRQIPHNYKIKSATISKTPTNKYFISILTEYDYQTSNNQLNKNKALGLDYASNCFYVDSQGNEANYPRFYRNAQDKLAKEQRKLSKMVKGSNNYQKQKTKVALIYEHITNQRKDWIHKLSTNLANEYDYICIEDLNMQNMSQCLHLGKSTLDNGFGMFRLFLKYKLDERGKQLIKIDKWFPSSKMCRFCGTINSNLTLADRTWTCECGHTLNRDENAAINILNVGLKSI